MTPEYIYLGTKQQLQILLHLAVRLWHSTFLFVDLFLPYFVSRYLCSNILCVKSFRLMEGRALSMTSVMGRDKTRQLVSSRQLT